LLQISAGEQIFLIDTMRLTALEALEEVVLRPEVEWVFHDGKQDVQLLADRLHFTSYPTLFDTQIAWTLLGPEPSVALSYLIYRVLGIRSPKEHQADDWRHRPLTESQLEYSAHDIEYLPRLREELFHRLADQHKQELMSDVCSEVYQAKSPRLDCGSAVSLDDFRNTWELDYAGQAALRFLIDWYNSLPAEERPQGMRPNALFVIARRMPESGKELAQIKGIPYQWAKQWGDQLTGQLIRATYEAKGRDYQLLEPSPYATFRDIRIDAWLTAAKAVVSEAVSIAPNVAFPPWLIDKLRAAIVAAGNIEAAAQEFMGWRQAWIAPRYIAFCSQCPWTL
jgi:ribonuclease D